MKKYWDAIKLFIWSVGIYLVWNLAIIIESIVRGPVVGARLGGLIWGAVIVDPICLTLIALGIYRAFRIYLKDLEAKTKKP